MNRPIHKAAARAEAWLTEACLPLWAGAGVDPDGAFYETLDFEGRPHRDSVRRMRVQARQLYVFSEAAHRGWLAGARAISDRGHERMTADCWASDGRPGFVHTLTADRRPLDTKRDAYDHAFGLFALAWRYKATGDERARVLAGDVLGFMDAALADPRHGGYVESIPAALPRRADPHMHLLEACLEWNGATGEDGYRRRAETMLDLFAQRFFDPATATLGEYFGPDLSPAEGEAGQVTMAGHHFEWVWLLDQAAAQGLPVDPAHITALYDFGRKGLDGRGLAVDAGDRQGRQTRRSRRAWPQTELIKAHLTMASGRWCDAATAARAEQDAADAAHAFLDTYLATAAPGLWMDQFDEAGRGVTPNVPASTLYHVLVAFRELILFAEAAPAA